MSNFYSKIAQMKRNSEPANMSYSQTQWINGEKSELNIAKVSFGRKKEKKLDFFL